MCAPVLGSHLDDTTGEPHGEHTPERKRDEGRHQDPNDHTNRRRGRQHRGSRANIRGNRKGPVITRGHSRRVIDTPRVGGRCMGSIDRQASTPAGLLERHYVRWTVRSHGSTLPQVIRRRKP